MQVDRKVVLCPQQEIRQSTWDEWIHRTNQEPLGHVLDAACGEGEFLEEWLALDANILSVTGIDQDPNCISEAIKYFALHGPEGIPFHFVEGDLGRVIPQLTLDTQPSPRWDTILLGISLHHLSNPKEHLNILISCLPFGGRLIVSEMFRDSDFLNPAQQTARDMHHLKAWVDRYLGLSHRETYKLQELIELLPPSRWELCITPDPQDDLSSIQDIPLQTKENDSRIEFLQNYLLHAKHSEDYAKMRREFTRLRYEITRTGYQLPPRLNGVFVHE